jgi:hypothetical protein
MSAFGDAFKAARASGDKTFTFGGKSYNTKTADDAGGHGTRNPVSSVSKSVVDSANDSRDPIGTLMRSVGSNASSRDNEAAITRGIPADIGTSFKTPAPSAGAGRGGQGGRSLADIVNGPATYDAGAGRGAQGTAAEGYANGGMIGHAPNAKTPNPPFKPFGTKPTAKPC